MKTVDLTPNQEHIVDVLIKKNPNLDRRVLRNAVAFIADAHDGQYRKSGMPYTEHPFAPRRSRGYATHARRNCGGIR